MNSPLEVDGQPSKPTAVVESVTAVLESALHGTPSVLHLVGPRGSGKTWWVSLAAELAHDRAMRVLRCAGHAVDSSLPYASLATLLAPVRDRLDTAEWAPVRSALSLASSLGALDAKITVFRFLCTLASETPLCLLLDDAHLLDDESRDVIVFALRRAELDSIACVAASTGSFQSPATEALRIPALTQTAIAELLVKRGVAPAAATHVAQVADGNPGIAVSLADGLTDQQRTGAAPISAVPRPLGALADELQARLRAYGDDICQALAVAAAERGGNVAAVRGALAELGASAGAFEAAEERGLIEVVGARFTFTDPWIRAVAYHLVAPGSRRAAHRALAAWFCEPSQGSDRVWHLAAGADGPSDAIAEALGLVALSTGRRGGSPSAAHIFERAAELAASAPVQQRNLKSALHHWISAGSVNGVQRVLDQLDSSDDDGAAARAEAVYFLNGSDHSIESVPAAPSATEWVQRRTQRVAIAAALAAGDHRAALRAIETGRRGSQRDVHAISPFELVAVAQVHRHAGRVREARESAIRAIAALDASGSFPEWQAILVALDLDVLQSRGDDVSNSLVELTARIPAALQDSASTLAARARLQSDPARRPQAEPAAFAPFGKGALLEIRDSVRDGVLGGDPDSLQRAIRLSLKHDLPIEAGEAQLWLAEFASEPERRELLKSSEVILQRCGVRGWDRRISRVAGGATTSTSPRPADAALNALSPSEFRVAQAVASGLTNREAAATLLISVKTVDFHLQQMYRKLGIRSRTELAIRMTNFRPAQLEINE